MEKFNLGIVYLVPRKFFLIEFEQIFATWDALFVNKVNKIIFLQSHQNQFC